MDTVSGWCQEHGLSVNPSKAVLVPFTRRRKLSLGAISMNGTDIPYKTWNVYECSKALRAYWISNRLFSKTWSLRPKLIYWSYTTVVRPIHSGNISYKRVVKIFFCSDFYFLRLK
jgi:hypothetical protein